MRLRRSTTRWLRPLLAVSIASCQLPAAAASEAGRELGALAVDSDPAGASVYVDGRLLGVTPVTLRALAPGDHRLRVSKQGFLESGRLIRVGGRAESIRLKLTADAAWQVEDQPKPSQGGSRKKWLLVGLGAAAAGTAGFLLLNKNSPPVAGAVTVSPSGTGLAAATVFTFTAAGSSDPDMDRLSFNWAFGDGATGTGETATHAYAAAGEFTITLTVSDGKASANATQSVRVQSMAGAWTLMGTGLGTSRLDLTQSGSSIGGRRSTPTGNVTTTVSGSVADPRRIILTSPGTPDVFYCPFNAQLTANDAITSATGSVSFVSPCTGSGTLSIIR